MGGNKLPELPHLMWVTRTRTRTRTRTVLIRLWSDHISLSRFVHMTVTCDKLMPANRLHSALCALQFSVPYHTVATVNLCVCATDRGHRQQTRLLPAPSVLWCWCACLCMWSAQFPHNHRDRRTYTHTHTYSYIWAGWVCASLKLHLIFTAHTHTNIWLYFYFKIGHFRSFLQFSFVARLASFWSALRDQDMCSIMQVTWKVASVWHFSMCCIHIFSYIYTYYMYMYICMYVCIATPRKTKAIFRYLNSLPAFVLAKQNLLQLKIPFHSSHICKFLWFRAV